MFGQGVGSDQSLGRPENWNAESNGFVVFTIMFANWLSGLLGTQTGSWKSFRTWGRPIVLVTGEPREKVVALCVFCLEARFRVSSEDPQRNTTCEMYKEHRQRERERHILVERFLLSSVLFFFLFSFLVCDVCTNKTHFISRFRGRKNVSIPEQGKSTSAN